MSSVDSFLVLVGNYKKTDNPVKKKGRELEKSLLEMASINQSVLPMEKEVNVVANSEHIGTQMHILSEDEL